MACGTEGAGISVFDIAFVPLGQLAKIETVMGPPMIKSEMGSLTGWVYVDIDTSDVGDGGLAAPARHLKAPPRSRRGSRISFARLACGLSRAITATRIPPTLPADATLRAPAPSGPAPRADHDIREAQKCMTNRGYKIGGGEFLTGSTSS